MSEVVFESVSKEFPSMDGSGRQRAVIDLTLRIGQGELVTLLGPSGCGKTTTLRMLAGFETPSAGRILVDGKDVSRLPVNERGIGMVFQSYALFPHLTVRENIAYGLEVTKISRRDCRERTDRIMELMALERFADRSPGQLSGGQQQRVALARAVVTEPRVLLFDEPLSNLDAQLRERMRDELRAIQKRLGITSLYVTHDQDEAMAISDRVVVMQAGLVEQDATTHELYTRPASPFVAEFIGNANTWSGTVTAIEGEEASVEAWGVTVLARRDAARPLKVGEQVTMVVRPEWTSVLADAEGPAKVVRAVYFGSHAEYTVSAQWGESRVVAHIEPATVLCREGDAVTLAVRPGTAWIIPGQGGRLS